MTDAQAKAAAMTALHEFKLALQNNQDTADIETRYYDAIGDIDDDTLREPLENALMILNDADAARLAQEYAKIAARFKGVQAGFDLGAAVAGAGQKGLFFPAAAALLGQMEGIVTELADTAKTVGGRCQRRGGDRRPERGGTDCRR
jgi:hypothetical protein